LGDWLWFRRLLQSITSPSSMSSEIFGLPRSAALRYREFALGAEGVPSASLSRKRGRLRLKCDGTHAETRFRLSPKRTSPFKSAGASVQSTAGSRGVRISSSSVRVLATHSIRQFPLYFPSRASPCAITFQLDSTSYALCFRGVTLSAKDNFTFTF